MALILAITAASGFLVSYCLLQAGMTAMWLRYLVAVATAYLAFLGLLWLWMRARARDYTETPDLLPWDGPGGDARPGHGYSGQGGESGGGGATSSYDEPGVPAAPHAESGDSFGGAASAAAETASETDDLMFPAVVVLILALLASLLSTFWIIYSAPWFLAELLVDSVFAATLYRALRPRSPGLWLRTAVGRTFLPFLVVSTVVTLAGWLMALYAPGARSIGDVLLRAKGVR
ncbi:MAG TPA: hypothetical protein VHO73_07690 [Methylomirabilota bacterium]|jgi:hypothetical protein|nr:hypothetical protein [Methylomirabilota bacterium]